MAFYEKKLIISKHAVQRYIERCEYKKSDHKLTTFEAELEMLKLMEEAFTVEISPGEIHYEIPHKKMIFIVIDNIVITFTWK